MTEFSATAFTKMQLAWGLEPTRSASLARDYLARAGAKHVLIPGIRYGRNAKPFRARDVGDGDRDLWAPKLRSRGPAWISKAQRGANGLPSDPAFRIPP